MGENAEYAETVHPFSKPFALSLFFAILYFIAKGRGKREIRGNHISIFAAFRAFVFFAIIYLSRKNAENAENAETIYHFSKPFALSHFFAILYLSRKNAENAKYAEIICPFSQSFAFFRNPLFYRERTRNTRNTRKTYDTFRSLSRFRIFSQSYILSRKNAEYAEYAKNIYHFSQPFALSHYFAIIYFIAKGRGKRGKRGNLGIYFGGNNRASFEHLRFICASYLNGD